MRTSGLFLAAALTAAPVAAAASCDAPELGVTAQPDATLKVTLAAPCHPSGTATLSHSGLSFRVRLDGNGVYTGPIPALDPAGRVGTTLDSGEQLAAAAPVADAASRRRFVLAVRGPAPLRLQAGQGIRLTILGDPSLAAPQLLQVADLPPEGPVPGLTLIAAVTAQSCGHDLLAATLLTGGAGPAQSGAVSLAMPDCAPANIGTHLALDLGGALTPAP